ncbi:MAG: tyrosine-type recombinase/integrase [Acidobacteriota bacterium]|nr:MAG: tyrosine-type recombinase/integrase [Acidobacteriota bacterium]
MPKQRTGYVYKDKDRKVWTARLTYTDHLGKVRNIRRQVPNKTEGEKLLKRLIRELDDHGSQVLDGNAMTFADLARVYDEKRLFKPTIGQSGEADGLKSYKSARRRLKTLVDHFGRRRIKAITHADIEEFKRSRLATPPGRHLARRDKIEASIEDLKSKRRRKDIDREAQLARLKAELKAVNDLIESESGKRTAADVNRDLQILRNVFNFAVRQGWMIKNPFSMGEPLISPAVEVRRERVLTREEEDRLLMACTGPRAHLRPLLIAALDTAMRFNELVKLRWSDVDLIAGIISVRATTTKTAKARTIGMTTRLRIELERLFDQAPPDPAGLVFGILSNVKRSFASACQIAGVEGFRFHDARHTAITRMVQKMPPMEVMKISGHTQFQTFARYVNTDSDAARRGAAALDEWHAEGTGDERTETIN